MFWKIEQAEQDRISGWIYNKSRLNEPLEVVAVHGDRIVGRALANEDRPHLSTQGHPTATCGFTIRLSSGVTSAQVHLLCIVRAWNCQTVVIYSPVKEEIGMVLPSYQSFLGEKEGSSDSTQKLAALRLPSLSGLKVLDLGCNEGFFCCHAWLSGASRVLGIDRSEFAIEKAKNRAGLLAQEGEKDARQEPSSHQIPSHGRTLEFMCGSWWDVPDEKFDIILFLSAIHYEENQKGLLDFLVSRLTPEGMLILECGVAPGLGRQWKTVKRSIDTRRFPTHELLVDTLLNRYAVRETGSSVKQGGDPIPRKIFYCSPKKPVVMVIRGSSGAGKSVMGRLLSRRGIPALRTDAYLTSPRIKHGEGTPDTPLWQKLQAELDYNRLNQVADKVIALGMVAELCSDFADQIPLEEELITIEGELFTHPELFNGLSRELKKRGAIVWSMERDAS